MLLALSRHGGLPDNHLVVPGLDLRAWLDIGAMAVHMVSAFAWLAMLAALTLLSWGIVASRDVALRAGLRGYRGRLLVPLWVAIGVLVLTGVYNQYRNVPFPLPHPWNFQEVTIPYGQAYVLLLLGKHMFIAQMVFALAVVTWRLAIAVPAQGFAAIFSRSVANVATDVGIAVRSGGGVTVTPDTKSAGTGADGRVGDGTPAWFQQEQSSELGTALIGTLALISGVLILATTAALGYVHLLTHGHTA